MSVYWSKRGAPADKFIDEAYYGLQITLVAYADIWLVQVYLLEALLALVELTICDKERLYTFQRWHYALDLTSTECNSHDYRMNNMIISGSAS